MANIWSDTFLSEDHIMIAEAARDIAQKEIAPQAATTDKEHRFPREIVSKLSELGFMGISVPTDWDGAGMDTLAYTAAMEEVSVACASTGVIMSVNNSLVCEPILKFGNEQQKEKYLKPLARGEKLGCFALSEPDSGSDAAAMTTKAVKKDGKWILNGVKNWITNGLEADVAIVFALTEPEKKHKGISAFIVENTFKGYQAAKPEDKLGIRGSSTTQILLDDCEVPEENLIGEVNSGFKVAMATLDCGRIGIACQAVGIARASLENALAYSNERKAFGKPINQLGAIQIHLADMSTKIDAARLLIREAALMKDQGKPYGRQSAQAKLYASEVAMEVTTRGIQVLGGFGYTTEYPQERFFRDAKITEIYEGTSEIQRLVISRYLVKELES